MKNARYVPQGIYRNDSMLQSSSLLTWTTEDTGGATSSSSSSSANIANASTTCAWCLRFGVRTLPGSGQCLETQRDNGCHRCDEIGCCDANCKHFKNERPNVAEAGDGSGRAAADIFERTPVQIHRDAGNQNVVVEFDNRSFIKGFASGDGCNCLIETLLACLNDNDLRCIADVPWIRQELRRRFRQGENRVTEGNYLDLRNHWTTIIDLIGISARRNECDPTNQIHARNFNVTAVLEEQRIVVERDGVGPVNLFVLNEDIRHFVPLLRNRQRWLQG